jgi:hypothetical protein
VTTFLLAFGLLLLATLAMAIGVIAKGRSIAGSCGGVSAIPGIERCAVCPGRTGSNAPHGARRTCPRRRNRQPETGAKAPHP